MQVARSALNLTQAAFCEKYGHNIRTYQKNEAGTNEAGIELTESFARAGINTNWLLTGEGDMLPTDPAHQLHEEPAPPYIKEELTDAYAAVPRYDRAQAEYGAAGAADDLSPDWSMLEVVLRAAEHKLKEPMTAEVADKILDLARAWTRHAEGRPDLLDRLDRVRTAAALLRPDH